ncbi:hypothetical protein WDU94_015604 [Cyamophila willieti]
MTERKVAVSAGDAVILFSGTNDVSQTSWKVMQKSYSEFLSKHKSCKVGVVLIPLRRGDHQLNPHISHINQKIASFLATQAVTVFDPRSVLENSDYSPDGLHLNRVGKEKICDLFKTKWTAFFCGDVEERSHGEKEKKKPQKKRINNKKSRKNNSNPIPTFHHESKKEKQGLNSRRKSRNVYYNSNYLPMYSNVNPRPDHQWVGGNCYDYDFHEGYLPHYNDFYDEYDNHYYCDPYSVGYRERPGRRGRGVGGGFFR